MSIIKHNLPDEETQLIEVIENDLLLPEYGEAMLYHDAGKFGFVKIGVKDNNGYREEAFKVEDLPDRLKYLPRHRDSYLSQSEFSRHRKLITNFLRTQVNFLDCDIYKMPQYEGRSAEELRDAFLLFCADNGIPTPSLIVYSGRGLYPKWLLDCPIPPVALVKWRQIQHELFNKLIPLGADRKAISVSNVLRIENTVNTKSGEIARVIWVNEDHGKVARWNFDILANEVLPFSKEQLIEMRRKQAEVKMKHGIISDYDKGVLDQELARANSFNSRLNNEHLALDRLRDVKIIANARFGPMGVPEGERDIFMFIAGALLAIIKDPVQYYNELSAIHQELTPSLPWNEVQSSTSTIYQKMKRAYSGEKDFFRGKKIDPRYYFTNQYLMEQLQVTPKIERKTITIFGRDERRRRQRINKEQARREQGVLPKKVYMLKRQEELKTNIKKARSLRAEGKKVKDIAQEMGKKVPTIESYLYHK